MADVLGALVGVVITTLLVGLIHRSSRGLARRAPEGEAILFEHGPFLRRWAVWLFGVGPALLFTFVSVMILWTEPDEVPTAAGCLVMAAVFTGAAWILVHDTRLQLLADQEGLRQPSLGGRDEDERCIAWADVAEVRFSMFWNALVVVGKDGTRIRASMFLRGFPLLVKLMRSVLPPRKIEAALAKASRLGGASFTETPADRRRGKDAGPTP